MLQKLGRLSQAKLNEELHAGDANMFFEKVHLKVHLIVLETLRQIHRLP